MPLWFSEKKQNNRKMKTVEIKNEQIYLNEEVVFQKKDTTFVPFIKAAYKTFEIKYSKFHKMDRLCKLAFVAAHVLLEGGELDDYQAEEVGVVMANKHATLHTDSRHSQSISDRENYYPSPKVFVYTLPNIMVGEICIKYNIKGESVFFVSNSPNTELLQTYAQDMIDNGLAKKCLAGWVDYTEKDYYALIHLL